MTRPFHTYSNFFLKFQSFSEELDTLQIVVGSNKLYPEGKVYKPEKFIIHESYDKPEGAYNIGLIRLQTPIEFNEKVQPIKFSKKSVEAGTKLTVTGWLMVKVRLFYSWMQIKWNETNAVVQWFYSAVFLTFLTIQ